MPNNQDLHGDLLDRLLSPASRAGRCMEEAPVNASSKQPTICRPKSLPPVSSCSRSHANGSVLVSITSLLVTVAFVP